MQYTRGGFVNIFLVFISLVGLQKYNRKVAGWKFAVLYIILLLNTFNKLGSFKHILYYTCFDLDLLSQQRKKIRRGSVHSCRKRLIILYSSWYRPFRNTYFATPYRPLAMHVACFLKWAVGDKSHLNPIFCHPKSSNGYACSLLSKLRIILKKKNSEDDLCFHH
jgi:hypothetical protein